MIETVLPAFIPVIADGARALFNRVSGGVGAKPANVGEVVQLMQADTDRLKAIASLDDVAGVSQWVANIRALQRPLASAAIILAYVGAIAFAKDQSVIDNAAQYAQMVTFYLFGDRSLMHWKRAAR